MIGVTALPEQKDGQYERNTVCLSHAHTAKITKEATRTPIQITIGQSKSTMGLQIQRRPFLQKPRKSGKPGVTILKSAKNNYIRV